MKKWLTPEIDRLLLRLDDRKIARLYGAEVYALIAGLIARQAGHGRYSEDDGRFHPEEYQVSEILDWSGMKNQEQLVSALKLLEKVGFVKCYEEPMHNPIHDNATSRQSISLLFEADPLDEFCHDSECHPQYLWECAAPRDLFRIIIPDCDIDEFVQGDGYLASRRHDELYELAQKTRKERRVQDEAREEADIAYMGSILRAKRLSQGLTESHPSSGKVKLVFEGNEFFDLCQEVRRQIGSINIVSIGSVLLKAKTAKRSDLESFLREIGEPIHSIDDVEYIDASAAERFDCAVCNDPERYIKQHASAGRADRKDLRRSAKSLEVSNELEKLSKALDSTIANQGDLNGNAIGTEGGT